MIENLHRHPGFYLFIPLSIPIQISCVFPNPTRSSKVPLSTLSSYLKYPDSPLEPPYLKSDSLISLFQHGWLPSGSHPDLFVWLSCHNNKSAPQNKVCQGLGRQSHSTTVCFPPSPNILIFKKNLHFKFVITHLWAVENRLISNGICAPYQQMIFGGIALTFTIIYEVSEKRKGGEEPGSNSLEE